jgi:hypothetical protein
MPDIVKLGKTMKTHFDGNMEATGSGINSAVV